MNARGGIVAIATVIALAAVGASGPAFASRGDVAVSANGRTWHPNLRAPLFDPAAVWVPGDVRAARFFVRNQGPTQATLSVGTRVADADRLHARDRVVLQIRRGHGAWHRLPTTAPGRALGSLHRGKVARVTLRARFRGSSLDPTMRRHLDVRLVVRLTQVAGTGGGFAHGPADGGPGGPGGAGGAGAGNGAGALPNTGAPRILPAAALAALLVGAGAVTTHRSPRPPRRAPRRSLGKALR